MAPLIRSTTLRIAQITILSVTCFFAAVQSYAACDITLTPARVEVGSPVLIAVNDCSGVSGTWLGHSLQFIRGKDNATWYAVAGVDVDAKIGPSKLQLSVHGQNSRDIFHSVNILQAHYKTSKLSVPPKYVEPGKEEMAQIQADTQLKAKVFANSAPEPLWSGSFHAPVHAQPTDSFGTRRIFNGKHASTHKGMDFRAAMGTPIRAGNSGTVVISRPLYYEGNCVVIDHGLGLYSLSMHMSRLDVKEGQHVNTGQVIGLSGATGRATGPHLHWSILWQGAFLDPKKMLNLNLNNVH